MEETWREFAVVVDGGCKGARGPKLSHLVAGHADVGGVCTGRETLRRGTDLSTKYRKLTVDFSLPPKVASGLPEDSFQGLPRRDRPGSS